MKKIKLGIIGLGNRANLLLDEIILMDDVEVVAVCDLYEDHIQKVIEKLKERCGVVPFKTFNYKELLAQSDVEAVIICTGWEMHFEIAIASMNAGKRTALEVGGAYDVNDCYRLVDTYEKTKTPFMFLENCCYGRRELMCLNMVKKGVFGEVVHCEGAYAHDLRKTLAYSRENRHYRLEDYIRRNCENYPTHELGPIAKILNINNGNRMLSLSSFASKAAGLHEYIVSNRGADDDLSYTKINQGDIITTVISCAGGETITIKLDTTLPHPYSRNFNISGTKAYYCENNDSVFIDGEEYEGGEFEWKKNWGNAETYAEKYEHPLWKQYLKDGVRKGHGGIDYLMLRAFFESIKEDKPFHIDVYDAAAWMVITSLSEQSIALGGAAVPIPDFTRGKWMRGISQAYVNEYRLDDIPDIR